MDVITFKSMFSDLKTIEDATVQLYLDMAAQWLSNDEILTVDPNYNHMQYAWTAHLMYQDNYIRGQVVNERVGDVGIAYHDNQYDDGYGDRWERLYYRLRANIQGFAGNISDTFNLPTG